MNPVTFTLPVAQLMTHDDDLSVPAGAVRIMLQGEAGQIQLLVTDADAAAALTAEWAPYLAGVNAAIKADEQGMPTAWPDAPVHTLTLS